MHNTVPYTYLIGWSTHKKFYYGCQYGRRSHPSNLWTSYFTSSAIVRDFRKEFGDPDIIQVRKTFPDPESCVRFEEKVLMALNKIDPFNKSDSKWLNANVSGAIMLNEDQQKAKGRKVSETKKNRDYVAWNRGLTKEDPRVKVYSDKIKGKKRTQEQKDNMKKPKTNTSKMGRYIRTEENKNKLRVANLGKVSEREVCQNCGITYSIHFLDRHIKECLSRNHPCKVCGTIIVGMKKANQQTCSYKCSSTLPRKTS